MGAHFGRSTDLPQEASTLYSSYPEDYWPCAGEVLTVNAIGTQLRDLTRRRLVV